MDTTTVDRYESTREGWLFFAGILLLLRGTVDVVNGLWAIDKGDIPFDSVLLDKLSHWGWVHLIVGVLLAAIGVCIILGQRWSIVAGVVLGGMGVVMNAFWLPTYPIHALFGMVLTVLALYGLVVYGLDRTGAEA